MDRGHEVVIYSMGSVAERKGNLHRSMQDILAGQDNRNIPVYYGATIDNRILRLFIEFFSLLSIVPELMRKNAIDTVFVYNISFLSAFVTLYSRLCGKQVFLEYEDSATAHESGKPSYFKKMYFVYEKFFSRMVNGVCAPSIELLDAIGVSRRLYLPGVISRELAITSRTRQAHSLAGERLKLLYCGNLDASRGIDMFIEAMNEVEYPLEIHISGKGPLEDKILQLIKTSRHKIEFHGLVSREFLTKLQTSVDIGLNPHLSCEHGGVLWPFKIIEYIAGCGVVFCARTGSMPPDIAEHLWIFEPDSIEEMRASMRKLISEWPKIREKAPQNMAWAIERFGPENLGKMLDDLMEPE
jgi:glycosyltransferase involved in cell wall biosynthesis